MSHHGSNFGSSPDSGSNSPQFPQAPLAEAPGLDPDRVVAYLRSVIRTPEPPPKPELRLLGFLRRKRRTEAVGEIHIAPAPETRASSAAPPAEKVPQPPAFAPIVTETAAPEPELLVPVAVEAAPPEPELLVPVAVEAAPPEPELVAPVAVEAAEPEPVIEECQPEPMPAFSPEPSLAESIELESVPCGFVEAAEPIAAAEVAEPEPYQIPALEAAAAQVAEEPATPEPAEPAPALESFAAARAPEPILESIPEPLAAAEPVLEPISEPIPESPAVGPDEPAPAAPPRPAVMRGEVLPPEAFRSGSQERRRPSEPARVITMQPAVRQDSGETPPPRRA